jgi:hypothetical protein
MQFSSVPEADGKVKSPSEARLKYGVSAFVRKIGSEEQWFAAGFFYFCCNLHGFAHSLQYPLGSVI